MPPVAEEAGLPRPAGTVLGRAGRRAWRDPRAWLAGYGVVLAMVAFWPSPVDRGMGPLIAAVTRAVPWLTYDVIEVVANIVLFVPLGLLTALALPRRRWLAVPIALMVTVVIEVGQALLLEQRTPSVRDVLANLVGAAIGAGLAMLMIRRSARSRAVSEAPTPG